MAELEQPIADVLDVEEVTPSKIEVKEAEKPSAKAQPAKGAAKVDPSSPRIVKGVMQLPADVKWTNRKKQNVFEKNLGALAFLVIVAQIALSILTTVQANAYVSAEEALSRTCPAGFTGWQLLCVNDDFFALRPTQCALSTDRYVDRKQEYFVKYANLSDADAEEAGDNLSNTEGRSSHYTDVDHSRRRRLRFAAIDGESVSQDDFLAATDRISRRLAPPQEDTTMWDQLDRHPQVAGSLLPASLVVGSLWVIVVPRWPKACMYASILSAAFMCLMMVVLPQMMEMDVCVTSYGDFSITPDVIGRYQCQEKHGRVEQRTGVIAWGFLLIIVVMALMTAFWRKEINKAADCIKNCCGALQAKKSIIGVCVIVLLVFVLYEVVWVMFIFNVPSNYEWKCLKSGESTIQVIDTRKRVLAMCFLLIMTYVYFEMLIQMVVACGVGGWYFPKKRQPKNPAKSGLVWAMSTSSHAVIMATAFAWPIVEARNIITGWYSRFKYLPFLPCGAAYYVTYALWAVALRPFIFLTRFSLIAHAFHSGNVRSASEMSYKMLKKRLGGACVTDTVGTFALTSTVMIMSLGFAVCAWAWMEAVVGVGILADIFKNTGSELYMLPCLAVMVIFAQRSLLTFAFIAIWGQVARSSLYPWVEQLHGYMVGVFVGAMANIIFSLLAKIIYASIDTTIYCYALEVDNAVPTDHSEIHDFVREHIVKPFPATLEAEEKILFETLKKAGKKLPAFIE